MRDDATSLGALDTRSLACEKRTWLRWPPQRQREERGAVHGRSSLRRPRETADPDPPLTPRRTPWRKPAPWLDSLARRCPRPIARPSHTTARGKGSATRAGRRARRDRARSRPKRARRRSSASPPGPARPSATPPPASAANIRAKTPRARRRGRMSWPSTPSASGYSRPTTALARQGRPPPRRQGRPPPPHQARPARRPRPLPAPRRPAPRLPRHPASPTAASARRRPTAAAAFPAPPAAAATPSGALSGWRARRTRAEPHRAAAERLREDGAQRQGPEAAISTGAVSQTFVFATQVIAGPGTLRGTGHASRIGGAPVRRSRSVSSTAPA